MRHLEVLELEEDHVMVHRILNCCRAGAQCIKFTYSSLDDDDDDSNHELKMMSEALEVLELEEGHVLDFTGSRRGIKFLIGVGLRVMLRPSKTPLQLV